MGLIRKGSKRVPSGSTKRAAPMVTSSPALTRLSSYMYAREEKSPPLGFKRNRTSVQS